MSVRALHTVILDARPFDPACIFHESTASTGSFCPSISACPGPRTAIMAAQLLGLHEAQRHQTLTTTA